MEHIKTIGELLSFVSHTKPNQIAYTFLADDGQKLDITYSELEKKAKAIAGLIQKHAKYKDRVLLIYPPGIELIAAYFGCMYAGVIAVMTYPPATPDLTEKLIHIINNIEPTLGLTTNEYLGKIVQLKLAKKILKIPLLNTFIKNLMDKKFGSITTLSGDSIDEFHWLATDENILLATSPWNPIKIQAHDIAFLQYTSGSTGLPKGVMVSHGNLLCNLASMQQMYNLSENEQCISWAPPYHDMGLIAGILAPLYMNFPSRLMSPISFLKNPFRWLEAITYYQGTCSFAPNFAFDLCIKRISEAEKTKLDLSHIRNLVNSAEPVRYNTIEQFSKAFAVCGFNPHAFKPTYGLAEGTLIIAATTSDEKYKSVSLNRDDLKKHILSFNSKTNTSSQVIVSSGQLIDKHNVCIVNPETRERCSSNQIGEIWISGPSVTYGYWQQTDLTAETFKAYLTTGEGPFLRSGDLGFIKDEHLYICGRLKDIIIIRGKKYYPQDIERCVEEAIPSLIRPGCSVAFSIDANEKEQLVFLAEVKIPFRKSKQNKITHTIIETISKEFGLQTHHIGLVPPKTLKKTTSGKIRRSYTKKLYIQNKLNYLRTWSLNTKEEIS